MTSPPKIRYCLYARKSMEAEERQALSIDSQLKEMRQVAERENLHISAVRTEAHSAKNSGGRKVFNRILQEIELGKYDAILTWAPDRLSRNAGDLGRLVDLMDQQLLLEVRTFNQIFTNSPNEKFLLMILGSQAKLENDNRGINVKRGLRALVERGCWPGVPPLGYRCDPLKENRGRLRLDPARAQVVKMIFEKCIQGWSYRQIYTWLKKDLDFKSPGGKYVSLSGVQLALTRAFYYGQFEYPRASNKWYKGNHKPIITKEIYDSAQRVLSKRRHLKRIFRRNFAYTKLMKCGLCGSGITGEEKFKEIKDGSIAKYVYYGCSRTKDRHCSLTYIREEDLIAQLRVLVEQMSIDELGVRGQFDIEVDRFYRFHRDVMGSPGGYENGEQRDLDIKAYVKYLLAEGTIEEKRYVLLNLRSRIILKDGVVSLDESVQTEEKNEVVGERGIILEIESTDRYLDRYFMTPERIITDEPRELPGGAQLVYNGQDLPTSKKRGAIFHFAMMYIESLDIAETVGFLYEYLFNKRDAIKSIRFNKREVRLDKDEIKQALNEELQLGTLQPT